MRVLIDCDPGHDDILAVMTALACPQACTILGLTTVFGNQRVEQATDSLLRALDHLALRLPVAQGAAGPLRPAAQPAHFRPFRPEVLRLPPPISHPVSRDAASFLYDAIVAQPEPVTLIALAPLTNLALLLQAHPDVKPRIAGIHLMGGSLHVGNVTPFAEFNVYRDPEAADIVFGSGVPLVMSPLEVCRLTRLTCGEYARLKDGGRAAKLAYGLLTQLSNCGHGQDGGAAAFDAVPVIHLLEPGAFSGNRYAVRVEAEDPARRGMTVLTKAENAAEGPVLALENVERARFAAVFLDALERLDRGTP